ECIQCALCIDACNDIMRKIDRPLELIAYDTIKGQEAAALGSTANVQLLRARTLLYAGLIAGVSPIMLAGVLLRTTLDINVLHERNPPFVMLADGRLRKSYTLKILNKSNQPRPLPLAPQGPPPPALPGSGDGRPPSPSAATHDV